MSGPLVIGHRGASGHRPEHTALAYRLAYRSGADSVEPDVLMTRDGVLVCRHDLDLSMTTDIAERPEFLERRRTQVVEGREVTGWFVHDLDLAELRTLRARERWPRKRPGSARFDGQVGVVTLEELLDLRADESARTGRELGVHIEVKHAAHLAALGLPVDETLVHLLRSRRLTSALSPVAVMGFEAPLLRSLRHELDVDLVQLVDHPAPVKKGGLAKVAAYATHVGLHKDHVLPRDRADRVGAPGKAVGKAVAAGLEVLVWTLRNENRHLPANLRVGERGRAHGDASEEVRRMYAAGVDGVLTDFPDVAAAVRRERLETARLARTS